MGATVKFKKYSHLLLTPLYLDKILKCMCLNDFTS